MLASLVTAELDENALDGLVAGYKEIQDTVVRNQPGWIGSVLLINRENGKGASIVFWESQAEAENIFESGAVGKL